MTEIVFDDKSKEPSSSVQVKTLGKSAILLNDIEQYLLNQFGVPTCSWKFYKKKVG